MIHWLITKENISLLDNAQGIEAGTLELEARNLDHESVKRISHFVNEHGTLLRALTVHPEWHSELENIEQLDFATCCPHLRVLDLKQFVVNASVFAHPSLEILQLLEAEVKGPQNITIGADRSENKGQRLKELSMMDCQFSAQELIIGPAAQLRMFQYYLDEDYAEPGATPERFVFQACPQLEAITIHVCASWTILISGLLPQLARISLDATEYCTYQWEIEGVYDQQKARYYQMLEQDDEEDEDE